MADPLSDVTRRHGAAGSEPRPDVLRLENLTVYYDTPRGAVHAVEDVSFRLHAQERFGLAGESGSGKSSMAMTIMRLLKPPARVVRGSIWLDDDNLLALPEVKVKELRLAQIALVAQGSMNSLNPVMADSVTGAMEPERSRMKAISVRSFFISPGILAGQPGQPLSYPETIFRFLPEPS